MKTEPLPDVRQLNDWSCATAAWKCVHQFHTARQSRRLDLSNEIHGTDPATLEAAIRVGRDWNVAAGEMMPDDLRHYVRSWRPVIVLVTLPGHNGESHYVTVGDVRRGRVYYQCSCDGWRSMVAELFVASWRGLGKYRAFRNWGVVAWPK
jgi:hypothetical protein